VAPSGQTGSLRWPGGLAGKGSTGVIDLVKRATGDIGYAERNYAKRRFHTNRAGNYVVLSVVGATAALESFGAAKDVRTPIVDALASAKEAYPISGVTFVLIPKDGVGGGDGRSLLREASRSLIRPERTAAFANDGEQPAVEVRAAANKNRLSVTANCSA